MSNLKLPNMTHKSISAILGNRPNMTIAFATTATRLEDGGILIRHHGNPIAQLWPDKVFLTNAGWRSQTTTARLHAIARDNFGLKYGVAIRNFSQVLLVDNKPQEWPWLGVTLTANGVN